MQREQGESTLTARRILILTHSDPTTDSRIIKTHSVAKAAGMSSLSLGLEESVASQSRPSGEAIVMRSSVRKIRDRLPINYLPGSFLVKIIFGAIYFEVATKALWRILLFRPHIIHCNDWFFLPVAVVGKVLTKAKLVYDAHELESLTPPNPSFTSSFIEKLERSLWPYVDFLTTVSPSIQEWYLTNMGPKNSEVILNSPSFEIDATFSDGGASSDYLRSKFQIPAKTQIYLYIGLFGAGRGIETILEAFSSTTSDCAVIFLGHGPYRAKIEDQGRLAEKIFLHERVDHRQVVEIARSSDYGLCLIENVSLSDYFCIPNKLLEYAFAGIPVIASRLPEIQRIVETYGLGKCFDNTIEGLIDVLERNDTSDRVKRVLREDISELSWETQATKLEHVLRQVDKSASEEF